MPNLRTYTKLPSWRRQAAIVQELTKHQKLTRGEIASIFGISKETASLDLRKLQKEGLITLVTPTASQKTNYYIPIKPPQ